MRVTTSRPQTTVGLRQGPSQSKLNRLAATLSKDYLPEVTRGGYRLGVSDGVMNAVSGFFTEEPAARGLTVRERATVAMTAMERLEKTNPELFKVRADDGLHQRAEKAKLSEASAMLRQVTLTGQLPERGWGVNPTRTLVGHMIIADDR